MNRTANTLRRTLTLALSLFVLLAGGTSLAKPRSKAPTPAAQAPATAKVNLNTATLEQLQYLPGVGPSKARAIKRYRDAHPFKNPSHIVRVKGIGRKTYRKLRPFLAVNGATTATAKLRLPRADE